MENTRKITKRVKVSYVSDDGFVFGFSPIEDTLTITETPTGYEARYLVQDDDAQSPDESSDDASRGAIFLVHYHRDFFVKNDKYIVEDDLRRWYQGEAIDQERNYWIFPVAAYIHSGVRLSLGSGRQFPDYQWDVSHVGALLVLKEEWETEEDARKAAQALIEEWNSTLSGDVYGIVKETFDKDKQPLENDHVWGYVGHKYALESLKNDI